MIPQIASALYKGYTTKQIIDYLLKKFPNQSGKIKDALAAGYTVDQVVKYLGGGKEALSNMEPEVESGVNTEYARTRQIDTNRERKANQIAMAAGTAAVGGLGAGMAAKAYQHALPANLLGYSQGIPPIQPPNQPTSSTPMGPGPNSPGVQVLSPNQNPSPSPIIPKTVLGQANQPGFSQSQAINPQTLQPPLNAENITQPPNITQPINQQRDIKKSVDILKNLGEEGRVKNLLSGGLPSKDIAGLLKSLMPKDKFKALESQEGGAEGVINDYAQATQQQPQELSPMEPESPQLDAGQPAPEGAEIDFKSVSDDPERWESRTQEWKQESWNDKTVKVGRFKDFNIYNDPSKIDDIDGKITVVDSKGNVVGNAFYGIADDGENIEAAVEVDPNFRRQGIASAMYENIEKITKKKLVPAKSHTPLAEALWKGKNRKFGKDFNETPKPIEKHATVSTPQGVGEVKEIRNGKALVEVDGKLHKVDEGDLEPPLYSDDEIAVAYNTLMDKIPEEHKSGFISWAGYDEDRNVLGFIPRGGKYEELHNITPEEAEMVKKGTGTARTTGEKREGLWVVGEDTRGGIISQIIWDRKKKKEAEEKRQLNFSFELPKKEKEERGMKPVFDEMKHARDLSRERDRKKKLEEREKKKKEKDEAKKRKK